MNTDKLEKANKISRDISEFKKIRAEIKTRCSDLCLKKNSYGMMGSSTHGDAHSIISLPSWMEEKYMKLIENDINEKLKDLEKEFAEM